TGSRGYRRRSTGLPRPSPSIAPRRNPAGQGGHPPVPWEREDQPRARKAGARGQPGRPMTETPSPTPAAPSEPPVRAQAKITIDDPHTMVKLLGAGDEILKLVERSVESDVHVRGNEITITGTAAGNALVERIFSELLELIQKGEIPTADAVRRTVGMLQQGT